MEFNAPAQPEMSLESMSLDDLPIVKVDVLHWMTFTRELSEEDSNRYMIEALEAAYLVRDFLAEVKTVEKPLRRMYRTGRTLSDADPELTELEYIHLGLMMDAILLRHVLGRTRFGPYLPHTRHRLYRQVDYLLSPKHGQSLRKSKVQPVGDLSETNSFAQLAGMPIMFAGPSSPLRERIYKFRDSYCKK